MSIASWVETGNGEIMWIFSGHQNIYVIDLQHWLLMPHRSLLWSLVWWMGRSYLGTLGSCWPLRIFTMSPASLVLTVTSVVGEYPWWDLVLSSWGPKLKWRVLVIQKYSNLSPTHPILKIILCLSDEGPWSCHKEHNQREPTSCSEEHSSTDGERLWLLSRLRGSYIFFSDATPRNKG